MVLNRTLVSKMVFNLTPMVFFRTLLFYFPKWFLIEPQWFFFGPYFSVLKTNSFPAQHVADQAIVGACDSRPDFPKLSLIIPQMDFCSDPTYLDKRNQRIKIYQRHRHPGLFSSLGLSSSLFLSSNLFMFSSLGLFSSLLLSSSLFLFSILGLLQYSGLALVPGLLK